MRQAMTDTGTQQIPPSRFLGIVLTGLVIFVLLTGAIFLATQNNTLGTDFFIYYVAGRQLTVNHGSPYAETVGEQSQMAILKHPAREGEDQLRFVYPPYGLIPILPLTGLPFPWAQAAWMTFTLIGIPASILYGFRRVSPVFLISIFFLYPLTFGLLLGNMNMPVMCILLLLAGRLPGLKKENRIESVILGVLMAWATIKPQFSIFFILFFLLLAVKNQNTTFLVSFLIGVVGLIVFSFALIPDWIPQWLGLIRRYPGYIGGQIPITPLIKDLSPTIQGTIYVVFAVLFSAITIWFLWRWWQSQIPSILLLAMGTFATYFFHPTGLSYDQMIFLLPFIFWILEGWHKNKVMYATIWLAAVAASWALLNLSLVHIWPGATYYGMYFLSALWILFLLWQNSSKSVADTMIDQEIK
jgi:hypothetical protein